MTNTIYRNRRAVQIENSQLRVSVFVEGGHIAELFHKPTDTNPLWTPPWPSLEPSAYSAAEHPEYGGHEESRLLAGISGHNICLDMFGPPSKAEAAAGLDVHGEGPIVPYQIEADGDGIVCVAELPEAGLRFTRRLALTPNGGVLRFHETIENLRATDRPIGWTEHVTLGPPFIERGVTRFRATGTRSKVIETEIAGEHGPQKAGAEFDWPFVPLKDGTTADLRRYTDAKVSGAFTTTLMDPAREHAHFLAWSPTSKLLCGYVWRRSDFPWLGRWEENCARDIKPWNKGTITLGMEFGVSPMPETRREMIERGGLFGVPGFRWIPARSKVEVSYCAFAAKSGSIPESVAWDGAASVTW
jgi:hypothetical protein